MFFHGLVHKRGYIDLVPLDNTFFQFLLNGQDLFRRHGRLCPARRLIREMIDKTAERVLDVIG